MSHITLKGEQMNMAEALTIAVDRLEAILKNNDGQAWEKAAKALPQLQQVAAQAPQFLAILTVEKEPDYWSGGHFHEGMKGWISPAKVRDLPIGTRLYVNTTPTLSDLCSGGLHVR